MGEKEDLIKTLQFESLQKISHDFRNCYNSQEKDRKRKLNKAKKGSDKHCALSQPFNFSVLCVADDYKPFHKTVLSLLLKIYNEESNTLNIEDWKGYLLKNIGVGSNGNDGKRDDGKKKKKKKKLTKEQQEQLQFASYLVKEIMPDRKREAFNQTLAYDEYTFLKRNKKLLFHGIDIDLDKVTFYKESDKGECPQNVVNKTKVGNPAVQFLYVDDKDIKEEYFQSVEDEGVREGETVKVTVDINKLNAMWIEAELGINDDKAMYLGAIGKIMEIEEDDDTVQLRWANLDTCWIPIKACSDSNGKQPTLPNGMISHLA